MKSDPPFSNIVHAAATSDINDLEYILILHPLRKPLLETPTTKAFLSPCL